MVEILELTPTDRRRTVVNSRLVKDAVLYLDDSVVINLGFEDQLKFSNEYPRLRKAAKTL